MTTGWIQTYTGQRVDPLHPDPATINIEDIAHGCAFSSRYSGQYDVPPDRFYSTAEHSLIMTKYVPPELRLATLLHDATDAYMPDMPSPYKYKFPDFVQAEKWLQYVIFEKFDCTVSARDYQRWIKRADLRILNDEQEQLFRYKLIWRIPNSYPRLGVILECLPPHEAEARFLTRYEELTR